MAQRAIVRQMLVVRDRNTAARQHLGETGSAVDQFLIPQIVTLPFDQVESGEGAKDLRKHIRHRPSKANDLVQFGGKLGIVGQLELAHPVRLEAMSTPYPLYRADANPGRLRHRRTGPVKSASRKSNEQSC